MYLHNHLKQVNTYLICLTHRTLISTTSQSGLGSYDNKRVTPHSPRTQELEPHLWVLFSVITKTPFLCIVLSYSLLHILGFINRMGFWLNGQSVFANGPEDWGSIPGWVIPKTKKTVTSLVWLVSLFNSISTFVGYLMSKPSFKKNSSGTI